MIGHHSIGRTRRAAVGAIAMSALLVVACSDTGELGAESLGSEPAARPSPANSTSAEDGSGVASELEQLSLRFASGVGDGSDIGQMMVWYLDELASRADGTEIEQFHGGSLLALPDTLGGVADGQADLGYVAAGYVPAEIPLWSVTELPWSTADPIAGAAAIHDVVRNNEQFQQQFQDAGVYPLVFVPISLGVTGGPKGFDTLEDYEGVALRGGGRISQAESAVGANTSFVAVAELYEAVQRGVVDGWSGTTPGLVADFGLHEVVDHFTDAGFGSSNSTAIVMDLEVWEGLSPEYQALLDEIASSFYEAAGDILVEVEDDACETFNDAGIEFHQMPESEVEEWKALVEQDMIDQWVADVAESGVSEDDALAILDAYRTATAEREGASSYVSWYDQCAGV